jgi:hypothetical protein
VLDVELISSPRNRYQNLSPARISSVIRQFTRSAPLGDDQGPDFDDMSSFFPSILCDARTYINPGDELLVTEM